jgi:hypothetical protein
MPKVSAKYKLNYLIYCQSICIFGFKNEFISKIITESRELYVEYPEIIRQLPYFPIKALAIKEYIRSINSLT